MADTVIKFSTYMCELITIVYFYDQVGLMRGGVLLAQSSPTALLKAYNTTVSHQLQLLQLGSQLCSAVDKKSHVMYTGTIFISGKGGHVVGVFDSGRV